MIWLVTLCYMVWAAILYACMYVCMYVCLSVRMCVCERASESCCCYCTLMVQTSFLSSLVAALARPQFLHNVLLHTVPVVSLYKNARLGVCMQAKMLIIATFTRVHSVIILYNIIIACHYCLRYKCMFACIIIGTVWPAVSNYIAGIVINVPIICFVRTMATQSSPLALLQG